VKVTLIDYGAGNVTSVERALRKLNAEVFVTNNAEEIDDASCLILPGVGHCAALITALDRHAMRKAILDVIARGVPFLGICLGLQALYAVSEEAPNVTGLGLLQGRVSRLAEGVKLPHMGWNQVQARRGSRLLKEIPSEAYFYFAHSYAATSDGDECVASCDHGQRFSAVIEKENIFGVQFHPEKSGALGAQLLENFLRVVA
jgi:imidazole glycerol-phosphate synthase subunit HisH